MGEGGGRDVASQAATPPHPREVAAGSALPPCNPTPRNLRPFKHREGTASAKAGLLRQSPEHLPGGSYPVQHLEPQRRRSGVECRQAATAAADCCGWALLQLCPPTVERRSDLVERVRPWSSKVAASLSGGFGEQEGRPGEGADGPLGDKGRGSGGATGGKAKWERRTDRGGQELLHTSESSGLPGLLGLLPPPPRLLCMCRSSWPLKSGAGGDSRPRDTRPGRSQALMPRPCPLGLLLRPLLLLGRPSCPAARCSGSSPW